MRSLSTTPKGRGTSYSSTSSRTLISLMSSNAHRPLGGSTRGFYGYYDNWHSTPLSIEASHFTSQWSVHLFGLAAEVVNPRLREWSTPSARSNRHKTSLWCFVKCPPCVASSCDRSSSQDGGSWMIIDLRSAADVCNISSFRIHFTIIV